MNELLAVVEKGKRCNFTWTTRDETGEVSEFVPAYFDVIRNQTGLAVLMDQPLFSASTFGPSVLFGEIDTAPAQFVAGEQYTVVLKQIEGDITSSLFVTRGLSVIASMSVDSRTMIDRLTYLRNDIENVVFPRLKRLLAFQGENLMIDGFQYDPAGNITRLRVRCFRDRETVVNATQDLEDSVLPELGEIMTLIVAQANDRPRCVRTLHVSATAVDAPDCDVTSNQDEDLTYAPGNEGGWPE